MIDNNLVVGIFPKIMVRDLVIMMVRDIMLDQAPPFE